MDSPCNNTLKQYIKQKKTFVKCHLKWQISFLISEDVCYHNTSWGYWAQWSWQKRKNDKAPRQKVGWLKPKVLCLVVCYMLLFRYKCLDTVYCSCVSCQSFMCKSIHSSQTTSWSKCIQVVHSMNLAQLVFLFSDNLGLTSCQTFI